MAGLKNKQRLQPYRHLYGKRVDRVVYQILADT